MPSSIPGSTIESLLPLSCCPLWWPHCGAGFIHGRAVWAPLEVTILEHTVRIPCSWQLGTESESFPLALLQATGTTQGGGGPAHLLRANGGAASLWNHSGLGWRTQLTEQTTMFTNLKSPICKENPESPYALSASGRPVCVFQVIRSTIFIFFNQLISSPWNL